MRNVTKDTLTQTFLDYCGAETSPRLRFVLENLVGHLHDSIRETELTHDEWRKAIELLTKAGEITTPERNEFVLFSDVATSNVTMTGPPSSLKERCAIRRASQ